MAAHPYRAFKVVNGPSNEDLMLATFSRRPGETGKVFLRLDGNGKCQSWEEVGFLVIGMMKFNGGNGKLHQLVGIVGGEFVRSLGWSDTDYRRLAFLNGYSTETRTGELYVYENKWLNPTFSVIEVK